MNACVRNALVEKKRSVVSICSGEEEEHFQHKAWYSIFNICIIVADGWMGTLEQEKYTDAHIHENTDFCIAVLGICNSCIYS